MKKTKAKQELTPKTKLEKAKGWLKAVKSKVLSSFVDSQKFRLLFLLVTFLVALGVTMSKQAKARRENILFGCNVAAAAVNTMVGTPTCVMNDKEQLAFRFEVFGEEIFINLKTKKQDDNFMEK